MLNVFQVEISLNLAETEYTGGATLCELIIF